MSDDPPDDSTSDRDRTVADAARLIAAGEPVDWPTMESSVPDDQSRQVLDRLRTVEGIVSFHRSWRGDSATSSSMPTTWGSLTIIEEIGRGSFGRVYRARDPRLDREVALKILDRGPTSDSPAAQAIVDEGRHLARLRHPNIVTIHGAERIGDRIGLEMELVQGRTLSEIVRAQGPCTTDEAALICRDVARALAAVHRAGLVHRDVKAQNVLRERGGRIVLMDFGAGRVTDVIESADIAGTPLYLAPELLAGAPPDQRSDLYSLGVLLFYLVTASFPIAAQTIDELREAHETGRIVRLRETRPLLPERFTQLVDRALAANPLERISSAGQFEAELSRLLAHVEGQPIRAGSGRWPLVASLAILCALGTIIWALWPRG